MRSALLIAAVGLGCGRNPTIASEPAAADGSEPSRSPTDPSEASATPGVARPTESSRTTGAEHSTEAETVDQARPETPAAPSEPDPLLALPAGSTSIGSPTAGSLEGGLALPLRAPGLMFLPSKDPGSRFGTVELVQGLVRAAQAVEQAEPGAPVTVGDLAREQGGDIPGHASHRSGRDVDVLFYLRHDDGRPFLPSKFIPLDPDGRGTDFGDLADPADDVPVHLDETRTWSFVAALLDDEAAAVQKILVAEHLRTRLLDAARRARAPAAIVQRFSEVTCQPRFPHDDHMHIRVFCSAEDIEGGCEDTPPIYPWRRKALAAAGVEPVGAGSKRATTAKKAKPKLKTIEQARADAGPMHEDVVEFLDRREAWAHKPHPGRRWCR